LSTVPPSLLRNMVALLESTLQGDEQSAAMRYLVKGGDPEKDVITIPGFAVFFGRRGDDG
jgi:hypothetical protein